MIEKSYKLIINVLVFIDSSYLHTQKYKYNLYYDGCIPKFAARTENLLLTLCAL